MSLRTFLGELAIFNIIRKWLFGKPNNNPQPSEHISSATAAPIFPFKATSSTIRERHFAPSTSNYDRTTYERLAAERLAADIEDYDPDELQSRIDDLESELDGYDEMSERYDFIQDEIDMLQDRIDDVEFNHDIYDDYSYRSDDLYSDHHDTDFYHDEDW